MYKQTMVHALTALRRKKSLLLDTCEVFVKDPLVDWMKDAKLKNTGGSVVEANSMVVDQHSSAQSISQTWYPRKKIDCVRKKLSGVHPVKILSQELRDSVHAKKDYHEVLERAIIGPKTGLRQQHLGENREYLDVED